MGNYYECESTLEQVQLGLNDLEASLGELSRICDGRGWELGGLLRMLREAAHIQRVKVDYLVNEQYAGRLKLA